MQSSKDSNVTISPNLLKNFDVYGILQPLKNGANSSVDLKVDKLIDIDDCSQDSIIQDCEPSFLDQNREFSLVDLYQNIFVTPQHIKQKDTAKKVDVANSNTGLDIDLKQFLYKYESSQKIDCTSKIEDECDVDVVVDKPRVLVPKVFMEPDSDPEDLINEIFTQKIMEKRALDELNRSKREQQESSKKSGNADVITDFSGLSLNKSVSDASKKDIQNLVKEMRPSDFKTPSMTSQITDSYNFVVRSIQKDEKLYKKNRVLKPEYLTCAYTKGPDFNEKSIVLPQIMARLNSRRDYLDEISNQKRRLILDTGSHRKAEGTVSNSNEKLKSNSNIYGTRVNSVKPDDLPNKDPKLCMNSVTGSISVHSTAGTCSNCNKTGGKYTNSSCTRPSTSVEMDKDFGKLSPTVLMEDCNKERLRALKRSQMIRNFVLTGKYEP